MTFFDYIKHKGMIPPEAREAIIFDATEIAEELDRITDVPETGSYPREVYGVCAPPFTDRYFWIESTTSTRASEESPLGEGDMVEIRQLGYSEESVREVLDSHKGATVRRGALCMARDIEGEEYREYIKEFEGGIDPYGDLAKWFLSLRGYVEYSLEGEKDLIAPEAEAYAIIGRDGTLLSDPSNTPVYVEGYKHDPKGARLIAGMITNMYPFALLSLSFLHRRTEIDHVRPSRTDRKRYTRDILGERKGTRELSDFYIVRVKPHIEGGEGDLRSIEGIRPLRDKDNSKKRAHTVRGHFRRIPEGGLFGRGYRAGELLWIPDHMRGVRDIGRTAKSYRIKKE